MSIITKIQGYQRDVKQLRVAAYCRVSTDNIEQLESLENQRSHYQKYITTTPIGSWLRSTMMKASLELN